MKLLETLLYIALFAFLFSGYVLFTQNFAQYMQVTIRERQILEKERLIQEYLRWNIHRSVTIKSPTVIATSTILILQRENGEIVEIDEKDLMRFVGSAEVGGTKVGDTQCDLEASSTKTYNSGIQDLQFYIKNKYLVTRFKIGGVYKEVEVYLLRLF